MLKKTFKILAICTFLLGCPTWAQTTTADSTSNLMTPELLWKLGRLGEAHVSADGQLAAYTVRNYVVKDNGGTTDLYVVNLKTGKTRKLLRQWASIGNLQFGKSPFGERLYLAGRQTKNGTKPQAWAVNPEDGGVLMLTNEEDGIGNLKVAPDGKHLAFTMDVKLDKEVKDIYSDLPDATGRILDKLMYRHWDSWRNYRYTHLQVAPVEADGLAGKPVDLMEGMKVDCPVPPFGGSEQFAWNPNGKQLAFTMKDVPNEAESTNTDVYLVDLSKPQVHTNISKANLGYDNDPAFSPDGSKLAYHSMQRPGFEADRNRIMVYDMASHAISEATKGLDQWANGAEWSPNGQTIAFASDYLGTEQLFQVNASGGGLRQLTKGRYNWDLKELSPDGKHALVAFNDMIRPQELAWLDLANGQTKTLSHINDGIYKHLQLPTVEERWVPATDGKKIHNWVIYPPNFDPNKKYPLLTYCQGGPQGMVSQFFSYRWNFHLMAANGYVIVAPNRRGLPGFGQAWNDEISGDWGGQAMKDILASTDSLLGESYIDKKKAAAIGASFGGYTVYWLMGHHEGRFATMVAHAGVFNLESMYGATEELFFANWEFGGPYWKSAAIKSLYDRFSPSRFVGNWDTPILIIHGEKDFRVPVNQGIEAFTAAQVKGIPSRFLYFPDEGHWVLSPQNGILWHRVFFEWLARYCK